MTTPLVSVLVAAYNNARFLPECLDSVLCQRVDFPMEIVLVDDGSTDDTARVAGRYPVRYVYQEHRGVAIARNRCLAHARGEWVAFIDADDLWTPDKLSLQLALAALNPDREIIFSPVKNFVPEGDEIRMAGVRWPSERTECYLIPALIKRRLLLDMGGFSQRYDKGEDTELLYRMRADGIPTDCHIDKPCYLRRLHGDNLTLSSGDGKQLERKIIADIIRKRLPGKRNRGGMPDGSA